MTATRIVFMGRAAASFAVLASLLHCTAGVVPNFTMSNGVPIPAVALGTGYHHLEDNVVSRAKNSSEMWLRFGGRHIDTAFWYDTEPGVAEAIAASGIARDEVFITTKLPTAGGYNYTMEYFENATRRLNTSYIDLFLIHTPSKGSSTCSPAMTWAECRQVSWRAMEDLYMAKKLRAIGVSNWAVKHLQDVIPSARVVPHVNQVELHPCLAQTAGKGLIEYMAAHDITVMSYAPLGGGWGANRDPQADVGPSLSNSTQVAAIASKYRVSPGLVLLQWQVQQGYVADVRSEHAQHLRENLQLGNFSLTASELATLTNLPPQDAIWFKDLDTMP